MKTSDGDTASKPPLTNAFIWLLHILYNSSGSQHIRICRNVSCYFDIIITKWYQPKLRNIFNHLKLPNGRKTKKINDLLWYCICRKWTPYITTSCKNSCSVVKVAGKRWSGLPADIPGRYVCLKVVYKYTRDRHWANWGRYKVHMQVIDPAHGSNWPTKKCSLKNGPKILLCDISVDPDAT